MSIFDRIKQANQMSRKPSVLNDTDASNITKYKTTNYTKLYEEEDEKNIFDIVKSVRKEKNYSPIPVKENNTKTYWNLVINKPKLQSPAGSLVKEKPKQPEFNLKDYIGSSLKRTLTRKEEEGISLLDVVTKRPSAKNEVQGIISDFIPELTKDKQDEIINDTWKTTSQKGSAAFMWALEAAEKPVNKLAYYAWETNKESNTLLKSLAKELDEEWLLSNIKTSLGLDNEFISKTLSVGTDIAFNWVEGFAGKATEWALNEVINWPSNDDQSIKNRLFWGVQPWLTPNLTSLDENRRRTISSLQGEQKQMAEQYLEDNKNEILAKDVLVGVGTGIFTGWAISQTLKGLDKASKWYKVLKAVDETVNPNLNNLAKVGWILWANAALYYWKTGEYVYWWDAQSEEWAIAWALVLGLKALWLSPEIAKWGKKYISELLSNDDVQKWFADFFDNYAKKTGIRADFIDDTVSKIPTNQTDEVVENSVAVDFVNTSNRKTKAPLVNRMVDKVKKDWLWDNKKTTYKNIKDYYTGKVYWFYAENRPEKIASLFWEYKWEMLKNLKKSKSYGKVSDINERISWMYKTLGKNSEDFNKYIWAKSRLQKANNYVREVWEELQTKAWGKNLTRKDLQDIVDIYEKSDNNWVFRKLADDVYKLNREVLNYELETGVRNADEVDHFLSQNPFYIKDQITEDATQYFQKGILNIQSKGWPKGKTLKWGTESFDFETEALNTLYDNLAARVFWANKNLVRKEGLDIIDEIWDGGNVVIRRLKKWDQLKDWEVESVVKVDWEDIRVAINKQWEEFVLWDPVAGQEIWKQIARLPTTVTKQLATGAFAPVHSLYMLIPETINAALYAKANWIPFHSYMGSFLNSMWRKVLPESSKNSFVRNPELRKAMEQLAKISGADFSFQKAIKQELAEAGWKLEQPLRKPTNKIKELYFNWTDFWHKAEMASIRIPVIESWLKQAWLTFNDFQKAVKEAWDLGVSVDVVLKKKGIDTDKIWGVARDVFNYWDASNALKRIGRYLPYANIAAVNTEMMKRLLTTNPKVGMWIIAGWIAYAQMLYLFNYSGEKGNELRRQESYLTHQSGFYFWAWEWEDAPFFKVKNIPIVEWLYPLVVEFNESLLEKWGNQREFNITDAITKMTKDTTYFVELNKWDLGVVSNLTPNGIKQAVEAYTNYDFFFESPIVSEYQKMPWLESLEYDNKTRPAYIKFANIVARATGWIENEDWIVEGWVQLSPKRLQKLFSPVDPWNYRTAQITTDVLTVWAAEFESLLNKEELSVTDAEKLRKLFIKTYKIKDGSDSVYEWEAKSSDPMKTYIRSEIRNSVLRWSKEEIVEVLGKYWSNKDYQDYIKTQMEQRVIKDKYWAEISKLSTLSGKRIAEYIKSLPAEQKIKVLPKIMEASGTSKQKNILKALAQ